MNTTLQTPERLLDALVAIFPELRAEWEEAEPAETFHKVVLRFTPFFGARAHQPVRRPTPARRPDRPVRRWRRPLENALSTCLLEHLHQIGAWKTLRPYLSDLSKSRSHA
jgi:hypothetical protein